MSEAENRIQEISKKMDVMNNRTYPADLLKEQIKKMRKLNEVDVGAEEIEEPQGVGEPQRVNKETPNDLVGEKQRLNNALRDFNVVVDYNDDQFKVYDDLIFSSGTIDGVLEFVMKVTPNDPENGIIINYDREDFDMQSDENNDLVAALEDYQENVFEPYWMQNIINTEKNENNA